MNRLARENILDQFTKIKMPACEYCLTGKTIRKPFGSATRAETALQLIHSNICGPMSIKVTHDTSYFISCVDDFTRSSHTFDFS